MTRRSLLATLLLTFGLSACSSDSTTAPTQNVSVTVPLNTGRVKVNGTLIGFKTEGAIRWESDSSISFLMQDSLSVTTSHIHIAIYRPSVGIFPVKYNPTGEKSAIIRPTLDVNSSAEEMIGYGGVVTITRFDSKRVSGVFSCSASKSGNSTGQQLTLSEGEFDVTIE